MHNTWKLYSTNDGTYIDISDSQNYIQNYANYYMHSAKWQNNF